MSQKTDVLIDNPETKTEVKGGERPAVARSAELKGMDVEDAQGEKLGTIHEVVLDLPSGRAIYAVLAYGGLLGLGEKLIPIPWERLTHDTERNVFVGEVDRVTLDNAPPLTENNWPDCSPERLIEIYEQYGSNRYYNQ